MFMNKFLNFILNLFLLRLLESPTLLTILHYVPTLGFMWHTLRTGFTCLSSRLNLKFVDTDESSPPSHQLLVHSDSSALRPLGSHQPAAPPPLVTWLSMGDDLPCWQAALNQKKEKRKKKKCPKNTCTKECLIFTFHLLEQAWLHPFGPLDWNVMSASQTVNIFHPRQSVFLLSKAPTNGIWWKLAACQRCSPHIT